MAQTRRKKLPYHASQNLGDAEFDIATAERQVEEATDALKNKRGANIQKALVHLANIGKLLAQMKNKLGEIETKEPPDEIVTLNGQHWKARLIFLNGLLEEPSNIELARGFIDLTLKDIDGR